MRPARRPSARGGTSPRTRYTSMSMSTSLGLLHYWHPLGVSRDGSVHQSDALAGAVEFRRRPIVRFRLLASREVDPARPARVPEHIPLLAHTLRFLGYDGSARLGIMRGQPAVERGNTC